MLETASVGKPLICRSNDTADASKSRLEQFVNAPLGSVERKKEVAKSIQPAMLALAMIVAAAFPLALYAQDEERGAGGKAGDAIESALVGDGAEEAEHARRGAVKVAEAIGDFFEDDVDRDHIAGDDVKVIQRALKERGYYLGPVDGIPGDRTRFSVKEFQQDASLPATGQINAATLRQLHIEPVTPEALAPYTKPNGSWVTLGGTVVSTTPNSFMLDYGDGLLTIEMEDWDWYPEASGLIEGDPVIVRGRIDAATFGGQRTSIEAGSVYVKNLNTYFYASAADEEGVSAMIAPQDSWFQATGTVKSINGRDFTLDTGAHEYEVDTITMPYNPLDDLGFQKIKPGDRVKAFGKMDRRLFEDWELMAASVITLTQDRGKASQGDSSSQ